MITLTQLIESFGHDTSLPRSAKNVYGVGHLLHVGYTITCIGSMEPNPDFDASQPESDSNPKEILVKHKIGIMTAVPDAGAEVIPCERADEATFVIEDNQSAIDPAAPICQVCGKPLIL